MRSRLPRRPAAATRMMKSIPRWEASLWSGCHMLPRSECFTFSRSVMTRIPASSFLPPPPPPLLLHSNQFADSTRSNVVRHSIVRSTRRFFLSFTSAKCKKRTSTLSRDLSRVRALDSPRWCRRRTERTRARWIELFRGAQSLWNLNAEITRVLVALNERRTIAPFRRKTSTKERLSRYYYSRDNDSDVRIVPGIACPLCCELKPRAARLTFLRWRFCVFIPLACLLFSAPIDEITSHNDKGIWWRHLSEKICKWLVFSVSRG